MSLTLCGGALAVPELGEPDPLDGEPFPDQLLRFGLQVPDGRQVTNMDMYPFVPEGLPPDQPVLVEGAVKVARAAAWAGARSGTWS